MKGKEIYPQVIQTCFLLAVSIVFTFFNPGKVYLLWYFFTNRFNQQGFLGILILKYESKLMYYIKFKVMFARSVSGVWCVTLKN